MTRVSSPAQTPRPRIAICGVHIECSTFSPCHTREEDFEVRVGPDVVARYPFLATGEPLAEQAEYVGILHARALPGGAVVAEAYDSFAERILAGLREQGPFDGILFDIHGAMSVVGMDDPEGTLITAIREVVGPDVVVSAPMDLHGNVSTTLFDGCDLLTCYRTAPHVDVLETRERALRTLLEALARGERPHRALVHVPVLLPGEKTSTRLEPARSLYARIPEVEAREGILDAAIWIGYAWADEPRNQGAVVVTGWDVDTVQAEALTLAQDFWAARHDFGFVAPTGSFDECLREAVASDARPFFISESGDNPGAGGADDVTVGLAALAAESRIADGDLRAVMASLHDPQTVQAAVAAGVGAEITVAIGGKTDTRSPGPVQLTVTVAQIAPATRHAGDVVLLVSGGLHVIVTSRRTQYHTLAQFHEIGVEPSDMDIVVVKMGYLEPDLFALQRGWLLALSPGGVDQDLVRLGHRRISRPMIPFDDDVPEPTRPTLIR